MVYRRNAQCSAVSCERPVGTMPANLPPFDIALQATAQRGNLPLNAQRGDWPEWSEVDLDDLGNAGAII